MSEYSEKLIVRRDDKKDLERYLAKLDYAGSNTGVNPEESEKDKLRRIERAKKDIAFAISYYFPHYATAPTADFQVQFAKRVLRDDTYKGFCQWGRGLAKSVWNNVFIPFLRYLRGEEVYVVIVGNSADRAVQLIEDLKAEFEANERIIHDWGEQKNTGAWEDKFYQTRDGRFIAQALGMGQSVRGLRVKSKRPDHIIVDDIETKDLVHNPARQNKMVEWIEKDLLPTMDGDKRRFVQANNRFAPRMIQTVLQERHPDWHVHQVNAYDTVSYMPAWKEKYDNEYFETVEKEIGILAARAEYNNDPHIEGNVFKPEQIQWCKPPKFDTFEMICGHWDIAYAGNSTSDYNAVRLWGLKDRHFYYIDSFVRQTKMRAAVEWIIDFQKGHAKQFIHWRFESQFWNDEVQRTISEAEAEHSIELRLVQVDTPRVRKYERIVSLQPYYQNGRIYYNEKKKPHADTQQGLAQLYGIEPGYKSHDDAPDADEQAISFLSKHIYSSRKGGYKTGRWESKNRY